MQLGKSALQATQTSCSLQGQKGAAVFQSDSAGNISFCNFTDNAASQDGACGLLACVCTLWRSSCGL